VVRPRPDAPIVERQDVVDALMDGEAHLHRSGGSLKVTTVRVRGDELFMDGIEGEAYTRAVVVEWTDANPQRPAPERTVSLEVEPSPAPVAEEPQPEPEPERVPAAVGALDDGLIVTADEDLSAVPPELR
jgi:hypothetical protein